MAHTCPDCGLICHCCGDIDDIDFGECFDGCTCCLGKDDRDDYDDSDYDPMPEPEGPHASDCKAWAGAACNCEVGKAYRGES